LAFRCKPGTEFLCRGLTLFNEAWQYDAIGDGEALNNRYAGKADIRAEPFM